MTRSLSLRGTPRGAARLILYGVALLAAAACGRAGEARSAVPAAAHAEHAHEARRSDDDGREERRHDDTRRDADGDFSVHELQSGWRDQTGVSRSLGSFAGTVQVVAMVYTQCSATCPLIVADLRRVEASVPPARRAEVQFVLVSLDPEHDTPERLRAFAAEHALSDRWTLLTGSDDAVRELAATLGVRYQRTASDDIAHSNAITVLDVHGRVAHQRQGLDDTDATIHAVQRLLR